MSTLFLVCDERSVVCFGRHSSSGSDLIYAKEGIPPLVETFNTLLLPSGGIGYLASIRRFAWEDSFFEGMNERFVAEKVSSLRVSTSSLAKRFIQVFEDGDISIHKFTVLAPVVPDSTA